MWLDNASSIDLLFYSPYADTVVKFAKNSALTPLTIGLYGSWGAGKSSLLNLINNKLEESDTEGKIACVSLNAWQFEGYEDAKIALMESLLKALNENRTFTDKVGDKIKQLIKRIDFIKLGKNVVKKGLPYALGILTGNPLPIALNLSATLENSESVVENISKFKENYIKPPEDDSEIENIRKFREEFQQMLEDVSSIDNLTVIIDDLDRCTPDRIIDTLEAIKLFLSVKKTTFIIAVDQRIIEYAVKTKYREIDGYEISADYIEKIIQLPIKIPELSHKDIENYLLLLICQLHIYEDEFKKIIDFIYEEKLLLKEKAIDFSQIEGFIAKESMNNYCDDLDEFKKEAHIIEKIRSVVSPSLKGNPRQTKRFLNTFFVRKNLSSLYFEDELDVSIIAKLLALEIIDSKLFKKINEWNELSKGKEILQLKNLEEYANNPEAELEDDLKKWDKPRVIRWLISEPCELYKTDLRKYYYLSRESLSIYEDNTNLFNEKEKSFLAAILNAKVAQLENLINELKEMSPDSQERIINSVLRKFKTDSEVRFNLISLLFAEFTDYQSEICDIIKTKEKSFFKVPLAPLLGIMYNVNSTKIQDLLKYLRDNNTIDIKYENLIVGKNTLPVKAVPRR